METVEMVPIIREGQKCCRPICKSGKDARWRFPQTAYLLTGEFKACNECAGFVADIVSKYHTASARRAS